jgi:hypothetical protein
MKHSLSALVLAFGLSLPALASAQELGSKGDVVFSVDRLMGVTGTHTNLDTRPVNLEQDYTTIAFGWRSGPTSFEVPRFSFDYLLIEHLSLGLSLGYASVDPDNGGTQSAFIFAPRVGYLYSFGRVVGIWPRGGLTYHSNTVDGGVDTSGLAFTAECPFTFSPATHFAVHIGPTFDVDMFGSSKADNGNGGSVDLRTRSFGLNAGILGWF